MLAFRSRVAAVTTAAAFVLAAAFAPTTRAAVPDSTLFDDLVSFHIAPAHPCPSASGANSLIWVELDLHCATEFEWGNWHAEQPDSTHLVVHLTALPLGQWRPWECGHLQDHEIAALSSRPAGHYVEAVEVIVTIPPDSVYAGGTIVFHRRLEYDVAAICDSYGDSPSPHLTYSRIDAATAAPRAPVLCPHRAIPVTLAYSLPGWGFEGLTLGPASATPGEPPKVYAHFVQVTGYFYSDAPSASGTIDLPGLAPGGHALDVVDVLQFAGEPMPTDVPRLRQTFTVADTCAPLGSALELVQDIGVGGTHVELGAPSDGGSPSACPHVPLSVSVGGVLPNASWAFTGLAPGPAAGTRSTVVATFRAPRADSLAGAGSAPRPFAGALEIVPGPPGADTLELRITVRTWADTAAVPAPGLVAVPYVVEATCGTAAVPPPKPPARLELLAAPNPAAGETRFVVRLPRGAQVDLALFDLAGRRVATLVHGTLDAGEHTYPWTGARSGLYFARLSVDGVVRTTRVALQLAR